METCSIRAFLENAAGKKVRTETMDGRKYIVAPTVMITVGVHNGSHGPVFYSEAELARTETSWNMKPVVVYHPKKGKSGKATAADPLVIETSQIGILMNTLMDKATAKLRTESWIDIEKANRIDPRIVKAIQSGKPTEVSTGMASELAKNEGTFGGVAYKLAATNIQPDHFAVLPDQIGACSIAAGAGLLVTNAEGGWEGDLEEADLVANRWLTAWEEEQAEKSSEIVTNGLSFGQITEMVRKILKGSYGKPGESWYGMVLDVFDKTVIFEDPSGSLFSQSYSVTNDQVALTGTATPVRRVFQYADAKTGKMIQNSESPVIKESKMDRKPHVDALITNGVFAETDRQYLMETMDEAILAKIKVPEVKKQPSPTPPVVPVVTNKEVVTPPTLEEYLANAPKALQAVLVKGVNALADRKKELVEIVCNASPDVMTKAQLEALDDDVLEAMAKMAAPKGNASGLSDAATLFYGIQGGNPTTVHNKAEKPPTLLAPGVSKKKATE